MKRKALSLSLVALIAVGGLVFALSHANVAHASGTPSVVQTASNSCDNCTTFDRSTLTATFSASVTTGDEIVVIDSFAGGNDCVPITYSDTEGTSFITEVLSQDGLYDTVEIAAGRVDDTESDAVTAEWSTGCGETEWVQGQITAVEVSGEAQGSSLVDGTAGLQVNGSGGADRVTDSTLSTGSDELDLAGYIDAGGDTTVSLISGETQIGNLQDNTTNAEWDQASAASDASMEFDTGVTGGYLVIGAISIASD